MIRRPPRSTLFSLHDALPILIRIDNPDVVYRSETEKFDAVVQEIAACHRSEEHTSELQSPCNLVCRLLLEKKNKTYKNIMRILSCTQPHNTNTPIDIENKMLA